jgi:hypothetical protein
MPIKGGGNMSTLYRVPYTLEELKEIIITPNLRIVARERGRTYVAAYTMRRKYAQWLDYGINPSNNSVLPFFEQFKKDGILPYRQRSGRPHMGSIPTDSTQQLEDHVKIDTYENMQKPLVENPDVEFEKAFREFKSRLEELIPAMAQQLFLQALEGQYKQTAKMVTMMGRKQFRKLFRKDVV